MNDGTRLRLIDTHAHLDEVKDVDGAISAAREAGVAAIIAVGQSYESNHAVLSLATRYPGYVFAGLGLHPFEVARERATLARSLAFIEDNLSSCVAVGEIGLDYDKRALALAEKDEQKAVLKELLAIAKVGGLPVSLHTRYAWKDSLSLVEETGLSDAIFHWFIGSSGAIDTMVASPHLISATPAAAYIPEHRAAVQAIPLDRLLLETDCPVQYGKEESRFTSAPADVVRSLAATAVLRSVDPAEVARATTQNAMRVFRLEGRLR